MTQHTPGIYVGSLDPEDESATMDCPCTLSRGTNCRAVVKLYHCPVHNAAPAMLEALRKTLINIEDFADPDGEFEPTTEGLNATARDLRKVLAEIDKGE